MSIIKAFDSQEELLYEFTKTNNYKLKNIFKDFWDEFLDYADKHNSTIRDVVKLDVDRMMKCKSPFLGSSIYKCPDCGTIMIFEYGFT